MDVLLPELWALVRGFLGWRDRLHLSRTDMYLESLDMRMHDRPPPWFMCFYQHHTKRSDVDAVLTLLYQRPCFPPAPDVDTFWSRYTLRKLNHVLNHTCNSDYLMYLQYWNHGCGQISATSADWSSCHMQLYVSGEEEDNHVEWRVI